MLGRLRAEGDKQRMREADGITGLWTWFGPPQDLVMDRRSPCAVVQVDKELTLTERLNSTESTEVQTKHLAWSWRPIGSILIGREASWRRKMANHPVFAWRILPWTSISWQEHIFMGSHRVRI